MLEKKNFVLNCDVCDARKIREEGFAGYEKIVINADIILVDERSREILNRLPMLCNTDEMLDVEGEVAVVCANGSYEIGSDTAFGERTLLCVNGNLSVRAGSERAFDNVVKICVNGSARYPESMASFMNKLTVNGAVHCIPDDCIELKPTFVIDKYFPLRARQGGKYYVEHKVKLTDSDVNVQALADKNVRFLTKRFLVREEVVPQAIVMFDENVELYVVPADFAYVGEDAELNEALLRRYGTRLYIDGDLTLRGGSEELFDKVEKLQVNGDVRLLKRQAEAFAKVDASYKELVLTKGRRMLNKALVVVDETLLAASPDGVEIENCAVLKVKKDVPPEVILEQLSVKNCAQVFCSRKQKSTLQLVCKNVAKISDGEPQEDEDGEKGNGGILGMLKETAGSKVVNADTYIL